MNPSIAVPWRILLVDDDEDEFVLTRDMLAASRHEQYRVEWRPDCEKGLDALQCEQYDAVLVDYRLGLATGVDLIHQARALGCPIPIILITGMADREIDREAMLAGASDYIDRSEMTPALLERTLRYAIRNFYAAQESRSQIEAERALLNTVIEKAPTAIFMTDAQGRFTVVNPEARKIFPSPGVTGDASGPEFGYTLCRLDGRPFDSQELPLVRSLKGETVENIDMVIHHSDGRIVYTLVSSSPILQEGLLTGAIAVMRDITDYTAARLALQASEDRELARATEIQAIMNAVPAAVWVARDPDSKVIDANRYGYEIIRMRPGQNTSKSAGEDEAPRHFKLIKDGRELPPEEMPVQVAARGVPVEDYEYDIVFDDGQVVHMLGNATPILKDDQPVGSVSAFINITERKKVEQALRQSEERLRMAVHAMQGFVWDYDLKDGRVYRSEGLQEMSGFTLAEFEENSETWTARINKEDWAFLTPSEVLALYGQTYSFEYRFQHKDGHWLWLQELGNIICDETGAPVRVIGATIDIDARKQVELALRESEERIHKVLDNTPTTMFTMDRDLRFTWIYNPGLIFTPEQILGKREDELLDPEAAEILMAPKREVLATGKPVRRELTYRVQDQTVSYHASFEPVFSPNGEVIGLSAVAMEITDLVQLRRQQIEDQAHIEIQRRIIEQREQERLQIARDLHDGPLQLFTGLSYTVQSLLGETSQLPEINRVLQDLKRDLHTGIAELRSYASELRPPTLSSFGLEKAIDAHLIDFRRRHPEIEIAYDARQVGSILPEAPRMALYRIYQELMNNIVKHAQASAVKISFQKTLEDAELIVQDNGSGFTVPTDWLDLARHKHLGLVGLQERAEAVGGHVEIISAPSRGTTVRVLIPLPE